MANGEMLDVSIITVTWNSTNTICEQIRSVMRACGNLSYEHIVVDNASTDFTAATIRQHFPHVLLLENSHNIGFAAANNQALLKAQGRYLLFLNADIRMSSELHPVISWMDQHSDIGILGPCLINEDESINVDAAPRRFPQIFDQAIILLKLPHVFPFLLKRYLYRDTDLGHIAAVDSVRGSSLLMRRELPAALGFAFDPRYFIWFEDVDICREAKRLGYKTVYYPSWQCVDYVGQSFRQADPLWRQRHFTASMLTYFKKWEPFRRWVWIAALRPVALCMTRLWLWKRRYL